MTSALPGPQRPPRLVLRFALYSAIALLLAGAGILWFVRHDAQTRAENEVGGRAARVSQRIARALKPADFTASLGEKRIRTLDELFRYELGNGLLRVKILDREGVVLYSSQRGLIGSRAVESDELARALRGEAIQEVTSLNSEGGTGPDLKTFETAVPIRLGGSERPVGVLQAYQDYGPVAADVRATVTAVGIALGLALVLLYAALVPILRQVTRTLATRNERLSEHTEALRRALAEREQAERKLGAAERGYRSLIEQLPLVTYIDHLDETSSSIYISPQVEGLLGYPPVAWLSDPAFFPKVLHPEDRERVLALHADAYASGEPFASEYRLLARDGRVVWVQDHVMIARDEAGRALHAQGFLLDVTERKHAEEELRLHNQELAVLHDTALGLIDRLDADSVLEAILERACDVAATEHAYLYLVDGDALEVHLGRGRFADNVGYRLGRGEGLAGRVWESGEPLAVDDYREWSNRRADFDESPLHAVVGVPLRSGAEVVGVLGLARDVDGRAFTAPEVAFLSRIGHLASLALESARLYGALSGSERRFRTLVSNVPGAIFRCAFDSDWTMEFLSDAIEEIAGYPAADFIANRVRSYASIVHPADALMLEEAVGDGSAPYSVEYRIVRRDGEVRWVLEHGQGVEDADGQRVLQGAIFDVTAEKAAESERLKLAAIVESSEDAIMGGSLDGLFTSWNAGAERMFGYTADEVIGRPIALLAPAGREGEAPERVSEVVRTGKVAQYETVRKRKDGSLVDLAFTYSPIRSSAGEIVGVAAIAQDIGERKRAEAALRESEAKFRAFVESTEEWVWEIDERGVLTYSNPAVERILGFAAEELVGRDSLEQVHPDDRASVEQELARVAADREGWSGLVLRWRHADGSYRYLESNATPILDADGHLRGWRGTDRDVTERMHAEAEREAARQDLAAQNERLRELDRLKDEFIALVSHELRTPLTSIRGYTELLLDGAAGDLSDEQQQFLAVVERNSHRLLHLVGDLLFLAQIEAGKLVLDVGALDVGAVASESIEAARPAAEEKGVTLTLATGPVPLLAADRSRIGQLLDNLISNAVKFTPAGGRVDVRVRSQAKRAVIEVRDSGIGIPASEQRFLFQRFFRTSTATEQAIQGTGLGLAISKAIVEAHAGKIEVESEEGAGTTFRVKLPLERQASGVEPEAVAL